MHLLNISDYQQNGPESSLEDYVLSSNFSHRDMLTDTSR